MRVGLMTWFHYHNYGTALQLIALSEKIRALGHNVTLLNYDPRTNIRKKGIFIRILKKIRSYISKFILKQNSCHSYINTEREQKFNEFIYGNISMTDECNTLHELERTASYFDVIVCGSDQIWSPLCYDPRYFLDFVHDRRKKIAYAPSIDTAHVRSKSIMKQIINMAGNFDFISVREKKAAEILSLWLHRKVKAVLDPALLLDANEWEKYITETHIKSDASEKYLLVYMLGTNERYWHEIYRVAEKLGLKVKIIPVFTNDINRIGCIKYPVGPCEFLTLFRYASFVCTDSFHGMIFSIIFHINFVEFRRFTNNDPGNQNFRIFNIAGLLSLQNRISGEKVSDDVLNSSIDFNEVESKLNVLREDSLCWLRNALDSLSCFPSEH